MRVAVTGTRGFPGIQGGVENHCEKLYPHFVKKGHEVTVFTRKQYVNVQRESYRGIALVPLSTPHNKFLEALIHTFKSVLKSLALHPDVLHIHAIGPSLLTPLARSLRLRVIVTNHGPDYKRKKWSPPAKFILKFCEWAGMKFANEIITISRDIADDVRRKYNRDAVVIPNGVEIPVLQDTDMTLRKFGIESGKYILTVGRVVPEKGFDDLIDAFNEANIDQWKLVLVGKADHEDQFSLKIKSKVNKNNNIVLTGFLTGHPLQELYSHAGLFVLPSYYEGLPIVLLEAMSYGLSCIASDIPANRNLPLDADRYFTVKDPTRLALMLKKFVNKPFDAHSKRKQLDIIAEKYNWEKIAAETMKVFERIAM